jgi:hypothetical protein
VRLVSQMVIQLTWQHAGEKHWSAVLHSSYGYSLPSVCKPHGELNGDPSGVALRPACASDEPNGDPTDLAVCR